MYSWRFDEFDTSIFGLRTAKIKDIQVDKSSSAFEIVGQLQRELKDNQIEYAVFRAAASDYALIQALEQSGFIMVDGLLNLVRRLDDYQRQETPAVRAATIDDLPQLRRIAEVSFDRNRVFNDPALNHADARQMYVQWIENSLSGAQADAVLVCGKTELEGMITLQKDGHIPLIAVLPEYRGQGLAKRFVTAGFNQFQEWGVLESAIETQIANIPAIRSYHACGFKIVDSRYTFRWLSK